MELSTPEFHAEKDRLRKTFIDQMTELGLVRRTVKVCTYDQLGEGVYGTIKLEVTTKAHLGMLEFIPIIGVRHEQVAEILVECKNSGAPPRWGPTVFTGVEYIVPKRRERARMRFWTGDIRSEGPGIVDTITRAVRDHGFGFWRTCADLRRAAERVERKPEHFYPAYILPVLWLLLGERRKAEKVMRMYKEPSEGGYNEFCRRLRARFEGR